MWLLRTDRAELKYFRRPPPKYAILSHVWGRDEQSFQDIRALSSSPHRDPRSCTSPKIRDCCIYAELQGYKWLWADMCCIDKTSSAELSEAINSMYQWYAGATVCYVYLADVSADEDPSAFGSSFRHSRWFTRGWTLQELLAPRDVQFLSREWIWIGDKVFFAHVLEQVTGIDVDVLTFRTPVSSVTVAKRMRWAANRSTTRVEDEAYSLMGIFGVHLPTIYGEGRSAFRRLQEEIMKHSPDHTLFTWGPWLDFSEVATTWDAGSDVPLDYRQLLADSPSCFRTDISRRPLDLHVSSIPHFIESIAPLSRGVSRLASGSEDEIPDYYRTDDPDASDPEACPQSLPSGGISPVPEFTITSHGVRARLPVIDIPAQAPQQTLSIALLMCRISGTSLLVGLVLHRLQDQILYHVGSALYRLQEFSPTRCVYFDPSDAFWETLNIGAPAAYTWRDIYIAQPNSNLGSNAPLLPPVYSPGRHHVFIPYWVVSRLAQQGFRPVATATSQGDAYHTPCPVRFDRHGSVTYIFDRASRGDGFAVHVGLSKADRFDHAHLWVNVEIRPSPAQSEDSDASCPSPASLEVRVWDRCGTGDGTNPARDPTWWREFGDGERSVRICVTRTGTGLAWSLNIKLAGSQFSDGESRPPSYRSSDSGLGTSVMDPYSPDTSTTSPVWGGSPVPAPSPSPLANLALMQDREELGINDLDDLDDWISEEFLPLYER